jgi:2-keto-3-deoxy-L-rhamnonate aldolase RhmA
MSVLTNRALERLRAGEAALGFGVSQLRSVVAAHIARAAGYHWLTIDLEHGVTSLADAAQICMAASTLGVAPIVRIGPGADLDGTRLLDNGAQGLLAPDVRSAEQARALVQAHRYPPRGRRPWGGNTFPFGYRAPPVHEAMQQIDREMLLAVMIESPEGVDAAETIAAVDGVDVLFVGVSDLSNALGVHGRPDDAAVHDAIERCALACARHGKVLGIGGVQEPLALLACLQLGARFVAGGNDGNFLLAAATQRARFLEDAFSERPPAGDRTPRCAGSSGAPPAAAGPCGTAA